MTTFVIRTRSDKIKIGDEIFVEGYKLPFVVVDTYNPASGLKCRHTRTKRGYAFIRKTFYRKVDVSTLGDIIAAVDRS